MAGPGPPSLARDAVALALAAARRIDPMATAAELLPTVAALQLEYSLGPTADGGEQFWVYAPNWSTGGRRQAVK